MVEQLIDLPDEERQLFSGSYTVRALRDSRYHNTAYAVAELIDNSIQANAGRIDLLCQERNEQLPSGRRTRLSGIAVFDNGDGMDARTLLEALKFGGGTRHNSRGIGKYGMGLPTSSMSQCKKVDVWTWQDGIQSALHASIDADEIEQQENNTRHLIPLPDQETLIPDVWKRVCNPEILASASGTLVVWSNLDKIQWKKGNTLVSHTATEVGRIHRKYINDDTIRVRAVCFLDLRPEAPSYEMNVVANDPLYLMRPTSTPMPWDETPMFAQWGEVKRYTHLDETGQEQTVKVTYSIVNPKALETDLPTQNPGQTERGMHARHNIGVSVVREGREIILEDAFLREGGSTDNPQNRWWGCEVSFSRGSDELFGLDHNKQMAAHFTQAAKILARDDRARETVLEEAGIDDEEIIYRIVGDIRDQTRAMMAEIRQMFARKRNPDGDKKRSPEKQAAKTSTDADQGAMDAGAEQPTATDKERESKTAEERIEGLIDQFIDDGRQADDARDLAGTLVRENLSYQFNPVQLDGFQMFSVRSNQGVLHINLNTEHAVYDLLKHIEKGFDGDVKEDDPAYVASVAIRLLLSSWARMEDQTESREERMRIQDIATRWGRQVDKMISRLRERDG